MNFKVSQLKSLTAGQVAVDDLIYVIDSNPTDGSVKSKKVTVGDLIDSRIYGISSSQFVLITGYYADPSWISSLDWSKITNAPSFVTSLSALTDVQLSTPLVGQALVYNGTKWVNQGIGELDTLNSVTTRGNTTTNSITVGGLTVATSLIYTDTVNSRVGIGTTSPLFKVDISNRVMLGQYPASATYGAVYLGNITPSNTNYSLTSNSVDTYLNGTSNINFSINDVLKLKLASTGNFLIGTTTDSGYKLDVNGTIRSSGTNGLILYDGTYGAKVSMSSYIFTIEKEGTYGISTYLFKYNDGTTALSLTGNTTILGIGGSDDAVMLSRNVYARADAAFGFTTYGSTTKYKAIQAIFTDNSTSGVAFNYKTGGTDTEAMRIASSGNIIVSKTVKSIYDNYSDLGTSAERFANLYSLTGRFTNVSTNNLGPNGAATWITISSSVFALVGGQLNVKGSGSTSATTSLLVQNSSSTPSLTVLDNGLVSAGTATSGVLMNNNGGYPSIGFWESIARWTIQRQGSDHLDFIAATNGYAKISFVPSNTTGGVGIGNDLYQSAGVLKPASAILSLYAESQGFLQPRLSTSQKNSIATPATGLQVYDSTLNKNNLYNGTLWQNIATETWVAAQGYLTTAPTLASVTTAGNTTTNAITVGGVTSTGNIDVGGNFVGNGTSQYVHFTGGSGEFRFKNGSGGGWYYTWCQNGSFGTEEKMRLSTNNNLLIGTTTDAGYKLDVNGTGRFSSSITGTVLKIDGTGAATGFEINSQLDSDLRPSYMVFSRGGTQKYIIGHSYGRSGFFISNGNDTVTYLNINSTGNVLVGTTIDSNAKFVVAGSTTAASLIARGVYFNNTLVAAANNDVLVGLDINPTYTLGSFSGTQRHGVRIQNSRLYITGSYSAASSEAINPQSLVHIDATINGLAGTRAIAVRINPTINMSDAVSQTFVALEVAPTFTNNANNSTALAINSIGPNYLAGVNTFGYITNWPLTGGTSTYHYIGAPNGQGFRVQINSNIAGYSYEFDGSGIPTYTLRNNNIDALKVYSTGNVGINTTTDAGYKLDVNGSARFGDLGNVYYMTLTSGGADGGILRVGGASYGYAELKSYGLTLNGGHSLSGTGGVPQFALTSQVSPSAAQSNAAIKFVADNPGSGGGIWGAYSTALAFNFLKKETGGTYTSILAMNGGTNFVGIGTTTPVSKLNVYGGDIISSSSTANRTTKLNDTGLYLSRTSDGTYPNSITADGSMFYDARGNHIIRTDTVTIFELSNAYQNVTIGSTSISGARLVVRGSGSTSATSSLLVQNSSGTELFKVSDNQVTSFRNGLVQIGDATGGGQSAQAYKVDFATGWGYGISNLTMSEFYFEVRATGQSIFGSGNNSYITLSPSAKVQIDSTTQGFLAPRMTTAQINAITSPAEGLQVYNTDLHVICFYDGTGWKRVVHLAM